MAGSVIQAIGIVAFEDGLRTEVLLEGCWCHSGDCIKPRINSNIFLGSMLVLGVGVSSYHIDPYQTKFQKCLVPQIRGIESRLLCGVRI